MLLQALEPCCLGSSFLWYSRKFVRFCLITLSNVFIRWLVKLIGLKLAGSLSDPPLCTGIMNDFFKIPGIGPELSDFFIILLNILEIGFLAIFRTVPETLSGPGAAPPGHPI